MFKEEEPLFTPSEIEKIASMEGPLKEGETFETITPKVEEPENRTTTEEKPKSIEEKIKEETGMSLQDWENLDITNKDNEGNTPANEGADKKVTLTPSSSNPSQMSNLAKVLHEAGVILSDDEKELDEVKDVDSLVNLVNKSVEAKKYQELNDEQKNYLEALKAGVPLDVYKQKRADHEIYSKISVDQLEENANLRHSIIKNSFILKGFSEAKANEWTKRSIEAGADLKDSQEALEEIKAYTQENLKKTVEEAKKAQLEKEEKNSKALEELKSTVLSKQDIFKGIQINSQTRQKIVDSITTPVGEKDGVPVNDLLKRYFEDNEFKAKVHAAFIITKGFEDFSKFSNNNKTNAVKELERSIQNNVYSPGVTQGGAPINPKAEETMTAFEKMFLNK